ncbi:hypothetical protein Nepgr_031739 [Nepenthes gracilis]|uniref:Uncharacterized protein n=1 Tax=Nepenthes gracilis TaxID=150966 RepID=A0AAD3Y7S1_NEPGR|nr:hypothetical protein Nepgr_031739 [Nepenthes gracilis]
MVKHSLKPTATSWKLQSNPALNQTPANSNELTQPTIPGMATAIAGRNAETVSVQRVLLCSEAGLAVFELFAQKFAPPNNSVLAGGSAFRPCACRAPFLMLNLMLMLSFEELVGFLLHLVVDCADVDVHPSTLLMLEWLFLYLESGCCALAWVCERRVGLAADGFSDLLMERPMILVECASLLCHVIVGRRMQRVTSVGIMEDSFFGLVFGMESSHGFRLIADCSPPDLPHGSRVCLCQIAPPTEMALRLCKKAVELFLLLAVHRRVMLHVLAIVHFLRLINVSDSGCCDGRQNLPILVFAELSSDGANQRVPPFDAGAICWCTLVLLLMWLDTAGNAIPSCCCCSWLAPNCLLKATVIGAPLLLMLRVISAGVGSVGVMQLPFAA